MTCELLVLDLFSVWQDLIAGKVLRGLRNLLVLFAQVFQGKDLVSCVLFDKKTSARQFDFVWDCYCSHMSPLNC